MRKIVITGGAGFIGSYIANHFARSGDDTQVLDNLCAGKIERLDKLVKLHVDDIRNQEALKEIFRGADYVFHTAALPRVQYSIEHPEETNEVNIAGTLNVLIAAKDAGVKKVIYSASSSAYGDQDKMPLTEDMPSRPKSPYGLQKYVGELYCRTFSEVYGLPTVSLRYFNVYGPGADPDGAYALVIGRFLKQKAEGKPLTITGDGLQSRDFTHVRDIARANILAAESATVGKGEVINIGAGRNITINKIAALIGGPVVHVAPRIEPAHTLADNSVAKKLLGWEPTVGIEDGISELLEV